MWAFDYLKEEVGIKEIYRSNIHIEINNKKIYLGHGDGLGPGDNGIKSSKNLWIPVSVAFCTTTSQLWNFNC